MYKRVEVDKRKMKLPCRKGCGGEFSPAGRSYHEKFCTGKSYKPGHTHSVAGRHDARAKRREREGAQPRDAEILCPIGCGYKFLPQGLAPHKRRCTGKGWKPKYVYRRKLIDQIPDQAPVARTVLQVRARQEAPAYAAPTTNTAPINDVKTAYEMYRDDFALGSAICHILACKGDLSNEAQINHLTQARDMLSLKIEDLSE